MGTHPANPTGLTPFPTATHRAANRVSHVGSVSFLNAKPLIYGLESSPDIRLHLQVPSKLLAGLQEERLDVALLPVIDYQRMAGLRVVPAGGIGCDGPTLTVRLFSHVPIEKTRLLACDTDSHTSVALARVLLAERFGIRPEFTDLSVGADPPGGAARLLIGDKVICEEPAGLPYQMDLGEAWKDLTGLPFVFAVWTARPAAGGGEPDLGDLPARLESAKRAGLAHVNEILTRFAQPRGWPHGPARRYLTEYLKFDIGPRQLEAIRLFHQLAARHGAIEGPPRELEVYGGA